MGDSISAADNQHALQGLDPVIGELLHEALLVHDGSAAIVYRNRRAAEMCPGERSVWEVLEAVYDGRLAEAHRRHRAAIAADPSCCIREELAVGDVIVEVVSAPLPAAAGSRVWLWRDVSHTRALERALKQRVELETMALFTAGVVHNFNNLLGSVLGAAELLQRIVKDDARAQRCLGIIEQSVQAGKSFTTKMSGLIKRSRRPGGSEPLADILHTVAAVFREVCGETVAFRVEIEQDLPPIAMNALNLMDVLAAAVSNAMRAVPERGSVQLSAVADRTNEEVVIKILDDGAGGDRRRLELWSAQIVATMYGGRMTLASAPGCGTQVTLTLPFAE